MPGQRYISHKISSEVTGYMVEHGPDASVVRSCKGGPHKVTWLAPSLGDGTAELLSDSTVASMDQDIGVWESLFWIYINPFDLALMAQTVF